MIKIAHKYFPFYGVKGNTHPVHKFWARTGDKWFGFLYCAVKWGCKEARTDFKRRTIDVFQENEKWM